MEFDWQESGLIQNEFLQNVLNKDRQVRITKIILS